MNGRIGGGYDRGGGGSWGFVGVRRCCARGGDEDERSTIEIGIFFLNFRGGENEE